VCAQEFFDVAAEWGGGLRAKLGDRERGGGGGELHLTSAAQPTS